MATDEVFMNVPEVRAIAKNFDVISDVLNMVGKTLEMLSNKLKSTAFIGLVGGTVVIKFLDTIKPFIDNTSKKCAEMSKDVNDSVDAYERGDALGAAKFH